MNVFISSNYSDDVASLGIEFLECDNLNIIEITKKDYFFIINNFFDFSLLIKSINGGFLIQERDEINISQHELPIVTKKTLTKNLIDDMIFASKVAKYVKSNAIVFAKNKTSIGIGAGQMSRIDAAKLASKKAIEIGNYDLKNSVVASDAFLPFPDTLEHIHKAGAIAIIQPGGSKKDTEIIELANKLNISMIFSSVRNFNH